MANFGELVLVLGDLHIPARIGSIPEQFNTLLVPGKIQHILCTGNLASKQTFDRLKSICPNVYVARGDFDEGEEYPEEQIVTIGAFKIGILHGHQIVPWGDTDALSAKQRELDVDILVTGHTHKNEVFEHYGRYIINPGSITGAYSPLSSDVVPSFVLMAIKDRNIVTYVYELRKGEHGDQEVKVSKSEFSKAE